MKECNSVSVNVFRKKGRRQKPSPGLSDCESITVLRITLELSIPEGLSVPLICLELRHVALLLIDYTHLMRVSIRYRLAGAVVEAFA